MLQFVKGNMFDIEADIRVNTVNCKGVMGAGVALAFKNRYPQMFLEYRRACLADEVHPGEVYVWKGPSKEWVINFPTKRHWREKSRYEDIASGLEALKEYLKKFPGIKVALPALGCGNGGLDWARVAPMISSTLESLNAEIYVFEPSDSLNLGRKNNEQSRDNVMRDLELLGFSPFELPSNLGSRSDLCVQVKGNAELLVNGWIALLTSREVGERELTALSSIAVQMGLLSNPPTVALIYQNSASEEIAQIFLRNGLAVILLLPFSPRVKKRVGLVSDQENKITYAILSVGSEGDGKSKKAERSVAELLRRGAYALLLSDPDPKLDDKGVWTHLEGHACFYVRYGSYSNEVVYQLERNGFRSIGRRADTGEPNLVPLMEVKNTAHGINDSGEGVSSQITMLASAKQLRALAEVIEKNEPTLAGIYMSLVFDLLPNEIRDQVNQILQSDKYRTSIG